MLALSVAKVAACFQVWKSISSDLVRQYDGLARNVQLIQTTSILENLVLKQKAFAFSQLKTEARRLAQRLKVKSILNMQLMEISAVQEPIFDLRTTNFLIAKVRLDFHTDLVFQRAGTEKTEKESNQVFLQMESCQRTYRCDGTQKT